MLGNTDKNIRSIVTTIVAAATAGVIAVGGLTWWELAGSPTMAREQDTQNITLVGEVPGTTPALNMAQAEKLASSRAALVKRLDEARGIQGFGGQCHRFRSAQHARRIYRRHRRTA